MSGLRLFKAGGFGFGHFFFYQFDGDLVIGLRQVLLEEDLTVEDFEPALDIFEAEAYIALVQLDKIVLSDSPPVVVEADEELGAAGVLGQVDKAGVAMFEDIVDQFLDDPEDNEFIFRLKSFPIVMESRAGVHAS